MCPRKSPHNKLHVPESVEDFKKKTRGSFLHTLGSKLRVMRFCCVEAVLEFGDPEPRLRLPKDRQGPGYHPCLVLIYPSFT